MTALAVLLLGALVGAAPTDLFRCTAPDGSVAFQDQPCAQGQQSVLRGAITGEGRQRQASRRLREWLDGQPPVVSGPANKVAPAARPTRSNPLPLRPTDERSLALCSEQFLRCARHEQAMDACIANIPGCRGGGAACCDSAFVDRYVQLRRLGNTRPVSVREALLGE